MFPRGEWASFQESVADFSWSRGVLVLVTRSGPMFSDALCWRHYCELPRIEIHVRSPSVIDMLTEFTTNEHLDMEGELAGRWDFPAQQQAMRVCVRLDVIWLDFVSRRLWALKDGEATISNLCPIAKRLTNLTQNHSGHRRGPRTHCGDPEWVWQQRRGCLARSCLRRSVTSPSLRSAHHCPIIY